MGSRTTSKIKANVNKVLVQELPKPVIKKFKRREAFSRFKDDIWAANLDEMGSLPSKNGGVYNLLCVIDLFTNYAWVKLLKNKKAKTVLNGFMGKATESKRKPREVLIKIEDFAIILCKNG